MLGEILGVPTIVQGQPHAESSLALRIMSKGDDPQDGKTHTMGTTTRVKWEMISKGVIPRISPVEGYQSKQRGMLVVYPLCQQSCVGGSLMTWTLV